MDRAVYRDNNRKLGNDWWTRGRRWQGEYHKKTKARVIATLPSSTPLTPATAPRYYYHDPVSGPANVKSISGRLPFTFLFFLVFAWKSEKRVLAKASMHFQSFCFCSAWNGIFNVSSWTAILQLHWNSRKVFQKLGIFREIFDEFGHCMQMVWLGGV